MKEVTRLVNRKIKPQNAYFFDAVTDILREEGYSSYWMKFREKMHIVFDENEVLKAKVEEMQKALEWYADKGNYGTDHLSKHGFIPIDRDEGERARQALKGATNDLPTNG